MAVPSESEEITLIDIEQSWRHDDDGERSDADDPHPDSIPELEGLSEDPPEPATPFWVPVFRNAGEHLDELRRRLVISLAVFVPLFIVGLAVYQHLWRIVIRPLDRAAPHLLRFQALGPSDGLIMSMRIAFAFALFLSLPVWLSQIWCFIAPGLTDREKRLLYVSLGSGGLLFCLGAAGAYFLGVPFALEFLLPFNQSLAGWENAFTGTGYVDFIITCCAGFGLAFELPLVMFVLGWVGILTPELLQRWWRVVVMAIVVLAAIMTPPDPFTLLLLAFPMLFLFLVGWWLVGWTQRVRGRQS